MSNTNSCCVFFSFFITMSSACAVHNDPEPLVQAMSQAQANPSQPACDPYSHGEYDPVKPPDNRVYKPLLPSRPSVKVDSVIPKDLAAAKPAKGASAVMLPSTPHVENGVRQRAFEAKVKELGLQPVDKASTEQIAVLKHQLLGNGAFKQ
jgi:hypothetical protein